MNSRPGVVRYGMLVLAVLGARAALCSAASAPSSAVARVIPVAGAVEISPAGAAGWVPTTQTNLPLFPGYRLRTGENSQAVLVWPDSSVVRLGALTVIEILPPHRPEAEPGLHLWRGLLSFFHRERPGRIRIVTRGAAAGIEGTELAVSVTVLGGLERTTLSVVDGRVQFGNDLGFLTLTNGQQAIVDLGQAPIRTPGFVVNNVLQWAFYYPAVLDLEEMSFTAEETAALGVSFEAYQEGDLLMALQRYPQGRSPASAMERAYLAGLLLAVGRVEEVEALLAGVDETDIRSNAGALVRSLKLLIATVKGQPGLEIFGGTRASELLASSYYAQAQALGDVSLVRALKLARQSAQANPRFSFAWARVAELEFSLGQVGRADSAVDRSLSLAERNAEALALKGYFLVARNRTKEAMAMFDQALAIDSALGNAWLGRGLARIQRGDVTGGVEDLTLAAAMEPQRSVLRSYLGKALDEARRLDRALHELELARQLDPQDPTPQLYRALLLQRQNRVNEAIDALEESADLTSRRRVYRSSKLLDQDLAVRSANLANIYRDAGFIDYSLREAATTVSYDYANYSAHLFLGNSFQELRDPNLVNLRFETPAAVEYAVANLLAPVGAGTLSRNLSQHEYSRLFDRNGSGVISETEYRSRGDWIQSGTQYGRWGNFAYALDGFYRTTPGDRSNNDTEQRQVSLQFKQQLGLRDTVLLQASHAKVTGGDLFQYYDPAVANPTFRTRQVNEPFITAGYHHQWGPGSHTLITAGAYRSDFQFEDSFRPTFAVFSFFGMLDSAQQLTMETEYHGELDFYSGEAQQIWQSPDHITLVGVRLQGGQIRSRSVQGKPSSLQPFFPDPPASSADQDVTVSFDRFSAYAYHHWEVVPTLWLIGGLSYDLLHYPENFIDAPSSDGTVRLDQVSPKGGLIWAFTPRTRLRAAYSRSISGTGLDQSIQIEPAQIAGFLQSFRSLIPESVAGGSSGAQFEVIGLGVEHEFETRTYVGVSGDIRYSDVERTRGAFDVRPVEVLFGTPSGLQENLHFRERSIVASVNQLLGHRWAVGVRYRLTEAELSSHIPQLEVLPATSLVDFQARTQQESLLHQVLLSARYHHPSGFFGRGEALYYAQQNDQPTMPGDNFWQFNLLAGYRLLDRRVEATVGLLNLTDQDYRLNPLTLYNDLPRERTFVARLRFEF